MKKILIASVAAAILFSAPALAAPADLFNWSGFYIGANGGGMDFKFKGPFVLPAAPGNSFDTGRKEVGIGGIHGGVQGQWGNFVLGVEASWEAALGNQFSSTNGIGNAPPSSCNAATIFACQGRITDIFSIGPRVGYAMNNWMIYGTGGYARASTVSQAMTIASGVPVTQISAHNDGWYYGGGIEWLVFHNFTVGFDYKHYDFQTERYNDPATATNSRDLKAHADALLLRMTIKQ